MATDKPKKRVRVKKTGSGDPTFLFTFSIDEEGSEILISATVGPHTAVNNITSYFPSSDTLILSSFAGDDKYQDDIEATITFSNTEVDFEMINETGLESNDNGEPPLNTIIFPAIERLAPNSLQLERQQNIALQCRTGDGVFRFLKENNTTAIGAQTFTTAESEAIWIITLVEGETGIYTIMNRASGYYLSNQNCRLFVANSNNSETYWQIENAQNGYSDSIFNIKSLANNRYLNLDTSSSNGANLLNEAVNWYLQNVDDFC